MLGKLQPDYFPAIFGPGQNERLDTQVVHDKFAELAAIVGGGKSPEEVAEGFITVAVENMANAIKKISVQRGYDVTGYLLNCFGGAGGQHACLVADALGMEAILIHPFSGLLSAYGIGLATLFASRQQALVKPLAEETSGEIAALIDRLAKAANNELREQQVPDDAMEWRPLLHLRYDGTDTTLPIVFSDRSIDNALTSFAAAHKAQFGFIYENKTIIVEAVSVESKDKRSNASAERQNALSSHVPDANSQCRLFFRRPMA